MLSGFLLGLRFDPRTATAAQTLASGVDLLSSFKTRQASVVGRA